MFCSNCGNKLQSTDKYCDKCGLESDHIKPKIKKAVINEPVPVVTVQKNIEGLNKNEPSQIGVTPSANLKKGLVPKILLIATIITIASLYLYNLGEKDANISSLDSSNQPKTTNLKSVVNILCDNDIGGSGTILSKEGHVLTNNHVIEGAKTCLVTLPDPITGVPVSIYEAKPIITPELSKQYDIATLEINNSYIDSEGKTWGDYPIDFPEFVLSAECENYIPLLGEAIKIYGYPVSSGGYNLTVTEGIISSFADDGNILTSAKVDTGNSGGLAINQSGCFIGIPSAVSEGEYQNLGVIISGNVINNFLDEIPLEEPLINTSDSSIQNSSSPEIKNSNNKTSSSESWIGLENGIDGWAFDENKSYQLTLTFQSISNPSYTFTAFSNSSVLDKGSQQGSFYWNYRQDALAALKAKGLDANEVRGFQFSASGYANTNPDVPKDDYRLIKASYNGKPFILPADSVSKSYRVCPYGYTNYFQCYP